MAALDLCYNGAGKLKGFNLRRARPSLQVLHPRFLSLSDRYE